jgi:hypothetical protein
MREDVGRSRGRAETPSRKQRLERSLRPSSARFTTPPNVRDRFDAWHTSKNIRRTKSSKNKPIHLGTGQLDEPPIVRSSKEKVTTPHAGEEITFTTSTSSGKDEFRQDGENHRSNRSSRKSKTRMSRRDDTTTTSEDDSTEIGYEVSVTEVAGHRSVPLDEGDEKANFEDEEEQGRHRDGSTSQRSNIVFNFSGISKAKSTEHTVISDDPEVSTTKESESSEEFLALYEEIQNIVSRMALSNGRTPNEAKNAFRQYYSSAKTLTTVDSSGEELTFGVHADIMKLIGILNSESTEDEKQGIVQNLYKMGIRVLTKPTLSQMNNNSEVMASHANECANNDDATIDDTVEEGTTTVSTASDDQDMGAREESNSLSSRDIDTRWEAYRTKYMDRQTPNSSAEVDERWERFKERALTNDLEKTDSGALSLPPDVEDDLIRDCIETGLPSPRMTQTWGGVDISSRRNGQDSAHDEKTSLQAPAGHTQLTDERSWKPPVSGQLLKRGQPDDDGMPQPLMVQRVLTLGENSESDERGSSNEEVTDPVISIGGHQSSDEINSSSTNVYSKPDDNAETCNRVQKPVSSADDETIASQLSGDGAVNFFKSLSKSGREMNTTLSTNSETETSCISEIALGHEDENRDDIQKGDCHHEERTSRASSIVNTEPRPSQAMTKRMQGRPLKFFHQGLETDRSSTYSFSSGAQRQGQSKSKNEDCKGCEEIPQTLKSEQKDSKCPIIEHFSLSKNDTIVNETTGDTNQPVVPCRPGTDDVEQSFTENSLEGSGIMENFTHSVQACMPDEEMIDECENETHDLKDLLQDETNILEISSSLTGATRSSKGRSQPRKVCEVQEGKGLDTWNTQPFDLSISCTKGRSFETKSSSSSHGVPSWRLDAAESLSDFILEIAVEKRDEIMSYHVHRHMLAVGSRKSIYMLGIFRTKTSRNFKVSLDERAASFVPSLLDYIYCHNCSINVTSENAMSLRQLGKIFKVIPLVVKVAEFILEDLNSSNMSTYVEESSFFRDTKVTELIVYRCAESLQTIGVRDPLWAVMEPELFLRVLQSPFIHRRTLSTHLSILVTEYITLHQYELSLDVFTSLTSEDIIPLVDREAALPLIELCEKYNSDKCKKLQERCAHTMACFWKTTRHEDRHRLFALLRNLPSAFTVDFLEIVESGRSSETMSHMTPNENNNNERETTERHSFSIGEFCDNLVGDDCCSVGETNEKRLSWRLEPDVSFSDWTIKVKHQNLKLGDVYHVHKQILSVGTYRSEFFAELFRSLDNFTSGQGVTVELDHEAAVSFPQVLDFIYDPKHTLHATFENAVVLRFLARVLGIPLLSKRVLQLVYKDICLDNITEYIKGAYKFGDERILIIASKLCATQIQDIGMESPLLEEFKPDFFARVVASSDIKDCSKCHLTILIAKYFSVHQLDETILAQLLKQVEVSRIDNVSALKLLKILCKFEKSQEIETLDQLLRRCANIVTENWNEIRDNHREEVFSIFPLLHPTLLTEIFDVIDRQYRVQHYESMTLQSRLVKRYRAQIAEANQLREQEVLLIQQELEERTAEMLAIQQSLEEKLARVNQSLNRRTGRSAAYGIHLPPSPVNSPQGKPETRIPRLQTKSRSTSASERLRAGIELGLELAREAARKDLSSAATCSPCTMPTSRSSSSMLGHRDNSVDSRDQLYHSKENRTENHTDDDATETATNGEPQRQKQTFLRASSKAYKDAEGEDAEMSA